MSEDGIDPDDLEFAQASELYEGRHDMDNETRIILLEQRVEELEDRLEEAEDLIQMAATRLREEREAEQQEDREQTEPGRTYTGP